MTKTLTEQWREGTLPRGGYYIKLLDGSIKQTDYDNISKTFDTEYFRYNVSVKEVLAPVPSYDEYQRLVSNSDESVQKMHILEKKLEVALEVLGIIAMHSKDTVDAVQAACAISQIKEMEGVK